MLKIKENIDFNELEKYSYKSDNGEIGKRTFEKEIGWQTVHIHEDSGAIVWTGDYDYDYIEENYYDELIEDLIQAGLVENIK